MIVDQPAAAMGSFAQDLSSAMRVKPMAMSRVIPVEAIAVAQVVVMASSSGWMLGVEVVVVVMGWVDSIVLESEGSSGLSIVLGILIFRLEFLTLLLLACS